VEARSETVAEIKIERKQRSLLPWILGLALLLLVIWALTKTMSRSEAAPADRDGSAASDTLRDDTPPRLRQYAQMTVDVTDRADATALAA
jgi:hypothetical protein